MTDNEMIRLIQFIITKKFYPFLKGFVDVELRLVVGIFAPNFLLEGDSVVDDEVCWFRTFRLEL